MKEVDAAAWFRDYLTNTNDDGEGNWTLAHGFVGSSSNNMGQESAYKWMKACTGAKRSQSLVHFVGEYAQNVHIPVKSCNLSGKLA